MEAAKSQIEHIAYHKGPLAILIFIVGLFILVVASLSTAATRGIRVKAKSLTGIVREIPLYSDYYALVIGCSAYRAGWPPLPNAVKDAREVANTLKRMGWKIHLLENPDSFTLRKALNSLVVKAGRKKDRAIFLCYSGHGHTIREADGTPLGYIIPVDAPLPHKDLMGFVEKAVNMRQIETVSKGILSRHVLMVFDSCFSGAIFALNRAAPSPYIEEKIARPVREYITAGGEDETVPDRSVFKTCFLQGIEDGYADLNRDGFVTGEELGAYLQEKVVNYTRKAQHPQFGKINNPKLDKGDFVILAGGSVVKRLAQTENGSIKIKSTPSGAKVWLNAKYKGITPLTLSSLSPGIYRVKVKKEGYIQEEKEVRVSSNRAVSAMFFLDPVERKGRLYVETNPPDARVRILNIAPRYHDGIELPPGRYHVEVSKKGYRTEKRWVEVPSGEDVDVGISLELEVTGPPPSPKPGDTWREPVTGMQFVWVPGGCYQMGCGSWISGCDEDQKPVHEVCLDGFWIGKYEVTVRQWRAFVKDTEYRTEAEREGGSWIWTGHNLIKKKGNYWDNPGFEQNDNHPVTCVSWNDVQAFIKWLSRKTGKRFRLPTEAEWEYAARSGGKKEKYSGGDDVERVAWYAGNSGGHTHPVGTKKPNRLGIYDMSGNVWEWCQDVYSKDAYSSHQPNNPLCSSGGSDQVIRGGSWLHWPRSIRCTYRFRAHSAIRFYYLGFRLVRTR